MLLIKTFVQASAVHGLGLFASAQIPQGTPIWRFDPRVDRKISAQDVLSLPAVAKAFVERYAFLLPDGDWILDGDDARFMNHSATPNQGMIEGECVQTVALRDIGAGEEILCNYKAFDGAAERKLPTQA